MTYTDVRWTMKKGSLLVLILAVAVLALALAPPANATCVQFGKLVSLRSVASGATIWLSNGGTVNNYYMYTSTNANIINALQNAMASGAWVRITGNADSCPTTGLIRAGGVITQVDSF